MLSERGRSVQHKKIDKNEPYPGALTQPKDISALADAYRQSAHALLATKKSGKSIAHAPFRLCALHAIELYLNAYLLARKLSSAQIRGMQHNLSERAELAIKSGLCLRKRTAVHLQHLTQEREYLRTRYEPEAASTLSQLNRITATLDEVAAKVTLAASK